MSIVNMKAVIAACAAISVVFAANAADATTATWKGEGADDDFDTAANWVDGVPSFSSDLIATFATGGSTASFTGSKTLGGLVFNQTGGFKVSAGDDDLLNLAGGSITVSDTSRTEEEVYEICAPVQASAAITATVPAKSVLRFSKNFTSSSSVSVSGAGAVQFLGPTTECANVSIASPAVLNLSGRIRNTDHSIKGAITTSTSPYVVSLIGQVNGNPIPTVISNVVFEKSVYLSGGTMGYVGMSAQAGTTNVFEGGIYMKSPWKYFEGGKDAAYIFNNKVNFAWTAKMRGPTSGTATFTFRNVAMSCSPQFCVQRNAHVIIEVAGNYCRDYLTISDDGSKADLRTDYAFTGTTGLNLGNYAATLELNGTTQHFKHILGNAAKFTINGSEGSRLVSLDSNEDPIATTNISCKITGAVGVTMAGSGTLRLKSQAFASTGPLTATNGVLELCAGATWLNGTDFIARDVGTIKFASAEQIDSRKAAVHFLGNGKIDIPSGVTLKVCSAYLGEDELGCGDYTGTSGALQNRITGGGTLRVAKGPVLILF